MYDHSPILSPVRCLLCAASPQTCSLKDTSGRRCLLVVDKPRFDCLLGMLWNQPCDPRTLSTYAAACKQSAYRARHTIPASRWRPFSTVSSGRSMHGFRSSCRRHLNEKVAASSPRNVSKVVRRVFYISSHATEAVQSTKASSLCGGLTIPGQC